MRWVIESREISDLIPHSKNPRILRKDEARQLSRSIEKFGLIDLPVVTHDNRVIGGHQRLSILKEMGKTSVDCWVPESETLTQAEIDELNIRLNKNQGDWDWDMLANDWEINDLVDWGFTDDDFGDVPVEKKKNPSVSYEFTNKDDLGDFMRQVESLNNSNIEKTKVKI